MRGAVQPRGRGTRPEGSVAEAMRWGVQKRMASWTVHVLLPVGDGVTDVEGLGTGVDAPAAGLAARVLVGAGVGVAAWAVAALPSRSAAHRVVARSHIRVYRK
ncbi:hypothetical protein AQI88_40090 [Streptomyces cellostaticus]|uniref:Uncharacterized protein n=1 Tax=Streptomyces cellostaticus TaxID=67285 RepID=A0A101N8K3_9ACTN|nr:hypothetical protein AQI88_40090 [Streptomyces cellostaticus]GHI06199.1 hypothetical protein Scel_45200 [Streptomyces cellostaticus]